MKILREIKRGVVTDLIPEDQPQGTVIESIGGTFKSLSEGKYIWEVEKGNVLSFEVPLNQILIAGTQLANDLVVFTYNSKS